MKKSSTLGAAPSLFAGEVVVACERLLEKEFKHSSCRLRDKLLQRLPFCAGGLSASELFCSTTFGDWSSFARVIVAAQAGGQETLACARKYYH